MNSSHLKQKLFQALHDLVAAGDIDKRLTHAGNIWFIFRARYPERVSSGSRGDQRNHVHHPAVERTGLRAEADLGRVWREADTADLEPVHPGQWAACSQG
jgi:hypothetical protein